VVLRALARNRTSRRECLQETDEPSSAADIPLDVSVPG